MRVIGGAEQQQQQQWCQQLQYQSPTIREEGGRGYHRMGPSHLTQAPEGAPLPRQGPGQRVVVQFPGSASHSRSIATTTAAVVSAVTISITINLREGRGKGYHHAGPSQQRQAPEGAPLPRQGPVQRVVVHVPGSARHTTSRATTAAAVVSAVTISININHRGGGDEDIIMRALTGSSGSRGRSTPEAGSRSESYAATPWKCES